MRILVHDHSGHPFQAELSRELARRGHDVTHSYVEGYVSGKGKLEAAPGETITFEGIGGAKLIDNQRMAQRLVREVRRGFELVRHVRQVDPDITMMSNVQIPTLVIFAFAMAVLRKPWVLWHQDVYAIAVKSFSGSKLPKHFAVVAWAFEVAERWCSKRAAAIVVIASSFVPVHEKWGTAAKVTVIPNWAPLDEIRPVDRKNDWAIEHEVDDVRTLLYSGTLGLKHNPELLVHLAKATADAGQPVRLVVVNSGPAVDVLRAEAERLDVPITLLPFQPYERLSEVLGSGDVLVVLLEKEAGAFSVPSKTLSYLCAGRPVLGLMPAENLASSLVTRAGGLVLPPAGDSVTEAGTWLVQVLQDEEMRAELGEASRDLAEQEFALDGCATKFEDLLGAHVPARAKGAGRPN
ncbi:MULTISPECIES: glycosyltransferase family 4 protein [unclassified Nocardioides]|uniref:glycosyltransferase family 4 protein n=1 Tax=unclassified Nocardioides TaxID=2615069 RepID=UPI0006FA1A2F|nr:MULTISPECIES: glycosyltransferase family 4 protein [unclassified Nocardioides]KRA38579.1 glycosyl transferase family 1 [Nocardioides sp. Root614]KRA92539.1 glycosyl transferase family 1 [Nocardioides sp. Root682]